MSKFKNLCREIYLVRKAYDIVRAQTEEFNHVAAADIDNRCRDIASDIMEAAIAEEITNREAQNLLTYIQIMD